MAVLDPAALNKMIHGRIQDVAKRRSYEVDPLLETKLRRAVGLQPMLPRTPLTVQEFGTEFQDGFTITKLSFESRPGFLVTGLFYAPTDQAPSHGLVIASDAVQDGKSNVCNQSLATSMALHGLSSLVIDPPGSWRDGVDTDRSFQGDAWEPILRMGMPAVGIYAWDLIRALDVLKEKSPETKVGIIGSGIGAEAATFAFLFEGKFELFVAANALGSHEVLARYPEVFAQAAGIAELGDVSDWFAARPPAPVLLMSCESDTFHTTNSVLNTANRLQEAFQRRGSGSPVRYARFLGQPDFNRRMREVTAAFVLEHFCGAAHVDYTPELRPLTDGLFRPYPSGTLDSASLRIFSQEENEHPVSYNADPVSRPTLSELALKAIQERYPEVDTEIIPWGRYGKTDSPGLSDVIRLTDQNPDSQAILCSSTSLDLNGLSALGLSAPEFVAQVIHLLVPGGPEGYESTAQGDNSIVAAFKSVKTLMTKEEPPTPPTKVEATGTFSSAVAVELKRLRPNLEIISETLPSGAFERIQIGGLALLIPGARYRK